MRWDWIMIRCGTNRDSFAGAARCGRAWLTRFGSHSAGENVCVNGVSYKLGSLLYGPDRPAVADKPISRIYDGYYRQLNFSV